MVPRAGVGPRRPGGVRGGKARRSSIERKRHRWERAAPGNVARNIDRRIGTKSLNIHEEGALGLRARGVCQLVYCGRTIARMGLNGLQAVRRFDLEAGIVN